jgi:hypothetical protein
MVIVLKGHEHKSVPGGGLGDRFLAGVATVWPGLLTFQKLLHLMCLLIVGVVLFIGVPTA